MNLGLASAFRSFRVRVAARPAIGTFGKNTYIALLPASVECCGKGHAKCRTLDFNWFHMFLSYSALHIISSEGSGGLLVKLGRWGPEYSVSQVESKEQAMRLAPDGLEEHWILQGDPSAIVS